MFKIFKFTLFFLGMFLAHSLQAQVVNECECEWNWEDEFVCVAAEDGNIIEFPNACFAACLGYGEENFVECQDGGWGGNECDCDWDWDEEFICVATPEGDTLSFPNACFAACEGYGEETIVACPEWDGGWGGNDCDCEWDWEAEFVCVETEDGEIIPFPNACFAACEGYGEETIVECQDGGWGGNDCDCEWDWDDEFICVATPEGDTLSFPNACFAACEGYGEETIVACPEWCEGWGGNECDCDWNWEDEFICVATPEGDTLSFPNACFAACEGYGEETIVACPEWDGGWGGNDCDCDWNWEDEFICVETEDGEIIPFPNACFAVCEGYGEETIVECHDGGWGGNDCDCDWDWEDEFICVATPEGDTIPFPNACFAACEGYGEETIVECPEWDGGWNGNECDCDDEFDPVCVVIEGEEMIELPSACFAICLGFTEEDIQDCEGFTPDDDNELHIEPHISITLNPVSKVNLMPNPNEGRMSLNFTAETEIANLNISVLSLQGQVLQQQNATAYIGQNQVEIVATELPAGIYFIQLQSERFQEMVKFIKR